MLDLSFLTEEEYEKLLQVLQRDAELKKKDGDRIRRLQDSLKDEKKKKFVTGEWFHEVKAKRFQEDLEGPELLRVSIRKRQSDADYGTIEHAQEELEGMFLSSEGTAVPSPESEEERSQEPTLDSAEGYQMKPKPRLRLSTLPSTEKRSNREDVSPADSGVAVSPFLATRNSSEGYGKGHEGHSLSSEKLSERDPSDCTYRAGVDVCDGATQIPTIQLAAQGKTSPSSKIPVMTKSSKGVSYPDTVLSNTADKSEWNVAKRESLKSSKLPSLGWENSLPKQGGNYTVSSLGNKDEEISLDREHFKNLKNFWEKGGESALTNDSSEKSSEKASMVEVNGRLPRLRRSLSVQSNQSQNSDEKTSCNVYPKARVLHKRSATLSSSEDEPTYITPPRKGSGSSIPRSTYGRSKGAAIHRNTSDGNGKQHLVEEEKKMQRFLRRSKLPVRVPSLKIESPTKERSGIIFEPETPADEYVMADASKRKTDSLVGRVQILIESVSLEELDQVTMESNSETQINLEANEELPGDQPCDPTGDQPRSGAADEREAIQEADLPQLSERNKHRSSVAKRLPQANGLSLAKSMVNLYTTTETYSKPQMLTQQYLEPERAKDLSRSTPLLLSETESDTASEISFQFSRHKKSPSLGSHSSDMASVSSVSGSVLSVYSGDFGSVDAQGLVQFALDYDEKNREFQIYVSQCKDLAIVDEKKGRTDPYVKTYLLPDKARMGKRKTSVKKRTVNPVYNEVLRYKIEKMVLLIQKLNLSVWHNDPLGRNSFLGEMEVDLASWDWSNNRLNWYLLKPRSLSTLNCTDHRGVMNLSIKYVPPGSLGWKSPTSGEVHIWVKDTKDLPQLRPSGVDSFVKCYVLPDTSKKSYQKTRVIKRDSNPVFNHTIVYDGFHTEDLKDACVELTVWDHEKLTNHFLGGIRLGLGTGSSYGIAVDWMDSTQEEVAFWQEMMTTANEWIEGTLPLRSLAGKKKLK
ncbi:synaptotagmin-like protein 2 [Eublepharis macularius]|uniref:Synaptotagmin-like protein 2 n=1 Tax=Eublepharis macularius TaxID=481883 RepID=A0AA97KC93_EUBMA|nr:synaptotagmin-like protein 2 [Eublepharis macularius]XP_054852324.1 synaptotagmin-like protein 2 [Eublepharis macularius]